MVVHIGTKGISSDLGMRYIRGYSAEMREILSEDGRKNFIGFANNFFWRVDKTIVIVSDANPNDYNLLKMIELFDRIVSYKVAYVKLYDIEISRYRSLCGCNKR